MTRDEYLERVARLIAEGERLQERPTLAGLQLWLALSDQVLADAWGTMERYHLAWLSVGRTASTPRGRRLAPDEEAQYVRQVAAAKTAVLRTSLDAVARHGLPGEGVGS
jgi:hypothetical protein